VFQTSRFECGNSRIINLGALLEEKLAHPDRALGHEMMYMYMYK